MVSLTSINNRSSHQDPRPAPQRTHQVRTHTQQPQRRTSERSSSRDNPLQFLVNTRVPVSGQRHRLVLELLRNVPRARPGHFDPGFRENGTGGNDESDVDDGVEWVAQGGREGVGGGDVVCEPGDGG